MSDRNEEIKIVLRNNDPEQWYRQILKAAVKGVVALCAGGDGLDGSGEYWKTTGDYVEVVYWSEWESRDFSDKGFAEGTLCRLPRSEWHDMEWSFLQLIENKLILATDTEQIVEMIRQATIPNGMLMWQVEQLRKMMRTAA